MHRSGSSQIFCLGFLAFGVACSGSTSGTTSSPSSPASIEIVDGHEAHVAAGQVHGLAARVLDSAGEPISGIAVAWSIASGGGALAEQETLTQADGIASAAWTVGAAVGGGAVTATVDGLVPVEFDIVIQAGAAAVITPSQMVLVFTAFGETTQLSAQAEDAFGNTILTNVAWASEDEFIATVDALGNVTAVDNGATRLVASVEQISVEVEVLVAQRATSVAVSPPAASLTALSDTVQLSATASDALDHALALSASDFAWHSSDTTIATVDDAGLVTAVSVGAATITAALDGVNAAAEITIEQDAASVEATVDALTLTWIGESQALSVTAKDANGHAIPSELSDFAWSSSNNDVVTVSPAGIVTAIAVGEAIITVSRNGYSDDVSIAVMQIADAVSVNPEESVITALGATLLLQAAAYDAGETLIPLSAEDFEWSSSNDDLASVSPAGVMTAHAVGDVLITAAYQAKSMHAAISIIQVVATVELDPQTLALNWLGQTSTLNAVAKDANGHAIPLSAADFAWSSSDSATVSVDPSGTVTAVAVGDATITASRDEVSEQIEISVSQIPDAVEIIPEEATLTALEATTNLEASAFDAGENAIPLEPTDFEWSSSNELVATVSAAGVVTAVGNGEAVVTASVGEASHQADITVAQVATAVSLSAPGPTDAFTVGGEQMQLSATAYDANAHPLTLAAEDFTWSSDDTEVVTVSSGGLATTVASGTAVITAALGELEDTLAFEVTQLLSALHGYLTIEREDSAQLEMAGFDANGYVIDRSFALSEWTSLNPTVATVNAEGIVSAWSTGQVTITLEAEGVVGHGLVNVIDSTSPLVSNWQGVKLTTQDLEGGMWGASPNDVWAVGMNGRMLHFDGTEWRRMPSPTTFVHFSCIWGSASNSVWAAGGPFGAFFRYNGGSWTSGPNIGAPVQSLWGSAADNIWAVGSGGRIFHFDGDIWSEETSPTTELLMSVWGSADDDIWAVGQDGVILHYAGTAWAEFDNLPAVSGFRRINVVRGSDADNVWLASDNGYIFRYDAIAEEWVESTSIFPVNFQALWVVGPNNVWAVSEAHRTYHYDGDAWTLQDSSRTDTFTGVWGSASGGIWTAGKNGIILHRDLGENDWTLGVPWPTSQFLFGVWGSAADDIWAVGSTGAVLHYDGDTWAEQESPTTDLLYDVWGSSADNVWAVGTNGTIIHYNGDTWEEYVGSPTNQQLYGVWGSAPERVWAVGQNGTILFFNGAAWSPVDSPVAVNLNGVWGSGPRDAWAVGNGGTILRLEGDQWNTFSSPTANALQAVWTSSPQHAVIVGNALTTLHFNGTSWSQVGATDQFRGLFAVFGASSQQMWSGGSYTSGNVPLRQFNGTAWTNIDSHTRSVRRGIWAMTPGEVVVVGAQGQIIHGRWE